MSEDVISYGDPDDRPVSLLQELRRFLVFVAQGPLSTALRAEAVLARLDRKHPEFAGPDGRYANLRRPASPAPAGPTTKRLPFG